MKPRFHIVLVVSLAAMFLAGCSAQIRTVPLEEEQVVTDLRHEMDIYAIKNQQTIGQIASHYGVHPTQVSQWKKQVLGQSSLNYLQTVDHKQRLITTS